MAKLCEKEKANTVNKNTASTRWLYDNYFIKNLFHLISRKNEGVKNIPNNKEFAPSLEAGDYVYLLQGPPGCGKSSLPMYLAKYLNSPLYKVKSTDLSTGYDGATATNFKNIIDAAYKAARTVTNKLAIVVLDDIDTLFKGSSQEIALLQAYLLQLIDEMQHVSQTRQNKEKAEVLLFFSANYNTNQWLEEGALTRPGRAQSFDFKKMHNDNSFILEKLKVTGASDEEAVLFQKHFQDSSLYINEDIFKKLINYNENHARNFIKEKNITIENYYKKMFKIHFSNLDVSYVQTKGKDIILNLDSRKYGQGLALLTYKELKKLHDTYDQKKLIDEQYYDQLFSFLNGKKI
ncbi:MAG TPA: ATP-binding protein [Patescibacteria group bacterium]|nr:ATP-binding protein [Patescibacteria group bacterium]